MAAGRLVFVRSACFIAHTFVYFFFFFFFTLLETLVFRW